MSHRVHILGASGSGTTTLGAALAKRLGCPHEDADLYYWRRTDPPFTAKRPVPERLALLERALDDAAGWVLSGSMISWGGSLVPRFDLVVFLSLDPAERMRRLLAREEARHGARIQPGGDMAEASAAFLSWAESYDTAGPEIRSRALHEGWLAGLSCPVLRLRTEMPVPQLVEQVRAGLSRIPTRRRARPASLLTQQAMDRY